VPLCLKYKRGSLNIYEKSKVDYFITCDKEIINIYRNHKRLIKTVIVGILEFISLDRR